MPVGHMHCSVESGSRAESDAGSNYFLSLFRGSNPLTRPGETFQNLMQIDPPVRGSAEPPAAAEEASLMAGLHFLACINGASLVLPKRG